MRNITKRVAAHYLVKQHAILLHGLIEQAREAQTLLGDVISELALARKELYDGRRYESIAGTDAEADKAVKHFLAAQPLIDKGMGELSIAHRNAQFEIGGHFGTPA